MKEYGYVVEDPMGLHARPAFAIFIEAGKYMCSIVIHWNLQKADCKSLLAIMGLGAKKGDEVIFRFEGEDEDAAYYAIRSVLDKK